MLLVLTYVLVLTFVMQASFLSLNLNNLNEQLAKVDLAERLFIEPDVLPPELVSRV